MFSDGEPLSVVPHVGAVMTHYGQFRFPSSNPRFGSVVASDRTVLPEMSAGGTFTVTEGNEENEGVWLAALSFPFVAAAIVCSKTQLLSPSLCSSHLPLASLELLGSLSSRDGELLPVFRSPFFPAGRLTTCGTADSEVCATLYRRHFLSAVSQVFQPARGPSVRLDLGSWSFWGAWIFGFGASPVVCPRLQAG